MIEQQKIQIYRSSRMRGEKEQKENNLEKTKTWISPLQKFLL